MKYVSRDAAIMLSKRTWKWPWELAEQIGKLPYVDAEPVRHGRWSEVEHGKSGVLCECSACKEWMLFYYGFVANYCPNCGAQMSERSDENGQVS